MAKSMVFCCVAASFSAPSPKFTPRCESEVSVVMIKASARMQPGRGALGAKTGMGVTSVHGTF